MASCEIPGHPDSYGLGIRAAFYLQWFGVIVTSWVLPSSSDALNLRFLNSLTTAATAVGLAVNAGALQPAEVLVVLLLVCGALYLFVPVYLWRLATCCRQWCKYVCLFLPALKWGEEPGSCNPWVHYLSRILTSSPFLSVLHRLVHVEEVPIILQLNKKK